LGASRGAGYGSLGLVEQTHARYPYILWGKYNSNQETLQQILTFIDWTGDSVRDVNLWSMPPTNPITPGALPGSTLVAPDAGFSEYDVGRHDYT
jgi:hypothetical protein